MSRLLLIGGAVLGVLVAVGVIRGCDTKPTKVEQAADSVLATAPAWQDTVRARDSVIRAKDKARERERLARLAERKRADQAEAKADSLQALADNLALIPEGTASDSVVHLGLALTAQKKAAVQFALTVDSLKVGRTRDSTRLEEADATIGQMKSWRTEDLARIDTLTVALGNLRDEGKHRGQWKVLGAWLPPWMDEALLITGGVVVGGAVGYGIASAGS